MGRVKWAGVVAGDVLVLASASPRRASLLRTLGLAFTQRAVAVDESLPPGLGAAEAVRAVARRKADALAGALAHEAAGPAEAAAGPWLLAADTLVWHRGDPLGKPRDDADALAMLRRLAGAEHEVVTGLCVLRLPEADAWEEAVTSRVRFAALPDAALHAYVATGEPRGKAGAYAIQGIAGAFVEGLDGPWDNVVGLPLHATVRLLGRAGFPLPAHLRLGRDEAPRRHA